MVLISRRKPHFFSKKTHHFGSPAVRFSGRLFNQKPLRRALWREGSSCGEEPLIQKPSYGRVVMVGPCPKISVVEDVTHAGHVDECEKSQGIPCCTPLMIIPVAIPEVCPEIFLNLCWLWKMLASTVSFAWFFWTGFSGNLSFASLAGWQPSIFIAKSCVVMNPIPVNDSISAGFIWSSNAGHTHFPLSTDTRWAPDSSYKWSYGAPINGLINKWLTVLMSP